MRIDFQQTIIQTVNVDRVQTNVGNPQVAESIQHTQKTAEEKEANKKTETILGTHKSETVQEIEDQERRRKALLSQKRKGNKSEEKKDKEQEEREEKQIIKRLDKRV